MHIDSAIAEPLVYSIKDACRVSTLGRTKIHYLMKSGLLKSKRIGSRTLIDGHSLRQLVAAND